MSATPRLKLKVQIVCGEDFAIGPGKAALLEAIAAHGSISAAGRALGMSYRRAWLLTDGMNRCWREPLVTTAHGGTRGGGAGVTVLGVEVLARYRALEAAIVATAADAFATLSDDLRDTPRPAKS
jgi:molybdate transport system regulatory protein